ncbi:MAG: ABC transporter substrate-binding protein [Actinomycetota bacterium]
MPRFVRAWALVAYVVLAACGGGGAGDGALPGAADGRDGVRVAVTEDIWPLTGQGPASKAFAAGDLSVGVYEPLLRLGTDFTVQPGLAERWEMVGDQTWRFHLRRGVSFHDGRPFTADDVVWSWTGRQFLSAAVTGVLDRIDKLDDHTVDFVLNSPNLRLPEQLVHPEGPIVPNGSHNDSTPPAGTGPFKVVDYRPRQRVVVERHDGYWGEKARLEQVTFVFMPDPAERVEALLAGEVDVAANVPWASVAAIEASGRATVARAPAGATQVLSFTTAGALPDREVRQAVALAVDRSAYITAVLGGNGEPARSLSPPAVLGTAASQLAVVGFDPAAARRTLDDAGWRAGPDGVRAKDGRRLTLALVAGPALPEEGLRAIQGQLREVGIEVATRHGADITTHQEFRQRGYDLELAMPNQNDANPFFLLAGRAAGGHADVARTADSRQGVQQVAVAATHTQVVDELLVVPLAHVPRLYGLRPGMHLADLHPSAINQSWAALTASR